MAIIARQHDMNIESNKYYAPKNSQILHMYDKSKKSWSQRLKITKSEKTSPTSPTNLPIVPTYHDYATVEYTQSALARSMKYAEPWIYGTVRNIPVPPIPHPSIQTIFAPYPPDLAVVLCSCPEYLNGTKRDSKKASVCKKCKGSRLPLAPMGGTVRLRPTSAPIHQNIRPCAGTVRIIPTSMQKSRPSILDLTNDPYDLMRRSRLIPADLKPQSVVSNSTTKRAKSISPSRGRSRNRVKEREKDLWLEKFDPDPGPRKSILQCKLNPYDLISHKPLNHMNEFSPNGEEIFSHNYMNVKIAGQRIITTPNSTNQKSIPPAPTICSPPPPSATANNEVNKREQKEVELPKRPPRRKSNENALQLPANQNIQPTLPPSPETEQKQCIKSILKRPSGVSSPLPSPSSPSIPNDNDVKKDSSLQFINSNNVRKSQNDSSGSQFYIPLPSPTGLATAKGSLAIPLPPSSPLSSSSVKSSPLSPLPSNLPIFQARKKVQFMVEDKIIQDKDKNDDYEDEDNRNENVDVDDNKDNGTSFSVYDDVATTNYHRSGNGSNTSNATSFSDYDDVICNDNKNHKGNGNGNGSIKNCGGGNLNGNNSNNHFDTDDITFPSKHGRPSNVTSKKMQQQKLNDKQRADSKGNNDDADVKDDDTIANADDGKTKSKIPGGKKNSSAAIRRTFSERSINTSHGSLSIKKGNSTALLNFNDTMALRVKQQPPRSDSRDLFRPKDPPPPPPVNGLPTIKSSTPTSPLPSSPTKYSEGKGSIAKEDEVKTQTVNKERTVVRVAPFNKSSSEIHRLKILHTDTNSTGSGNMSTGATGTLNAFVDPSSTKRTSILINGDDCYSTVNVTNDTPLYQSSVVVAPTDFNTVTIKCGTGGKKQRTPEEEIIYKNNKINTLLNQKKNLGGKSVIPIGQIKPQGRTLIKLDYEEPKPTTSTETTSTTSTNPDVFSHEEELVKILRNPVEAVRRNLVPHICGKEKSPTVTAPTTTTTTSTVKIEKNSLIGKLLEDPMLHHLADGLESDTVAKLIENSLKRLKANRSALDTSGTKDNDDMEKLINTSLAKIKEERLRLESIAANNHPKIIEEQEIQSNRESISSGTSFSSANYEVFDFDFNNESDCYQSCSSELTTAGDEDTNSMKNKFYQMLVDATLAEIEISASNDNDYEHQYESIRINGDPIYEEISEIPPPLPLSPPPLLDLDLEKKNAKSIFEGASKYDILSYLVDAKERGIVRETLQEEESDTLTDLNSNEEHPNKPIDIERNDSGVGSETSKSSRSKFQPTGNANQQQPEDDPSNGRNIQIHLCEDCDDPVDTQITESGVMFAPLVCRKCGKKRAERKEIITEIVETEEKYGRDLLIILEEFYRPMLVAGLLTQEQLSAIFLNTEELLENNQALAERMRDALDIALEQGDDDLLTVNVGKIFMESTQMLHAFESYCVRQAAASLLLANMEKEKELLRIFLKVSQMENTVLRRMNLNSFLMVPVQRVTKYPLLLARLYKVTPSHLDGRDLLKQSQDKIELHLTHINQEAKDVPTKLWRRISSSSPNRRASCEIDMINIKLRKMAIDTLEWNHDEVRFVLEGKLLLTQPTDGNWKKGRTIKLAPVNALLVTNGKPSANYKADKPLSDQQLSFPKHTGIREASLLLVKEKCGRYTLLREPLYLDKCVVCTEADWDDYFEVHEISSKDTFIFKAEDNIRTKQWYKQLQYHSQGMGAWRKRRNALANIMINGMLSRT